MNLSYHYYSLVSGLAAAGASFFGKMITYKVEGNENETDTSVLQKTVFIALMIVSNALVWRYFVKGLHSTNSSTLVPTVISTASNFIVSGLLGAFIFKETTNFLWCVGALMILLGLYCILSEDEKTEQKKE